MKKTVKVMLFTAVFALALTGCGKDNKKDSTDAKTTETATTGAEAVLSTEEIAGLDDNASGTVEPGVVDETGYHNKSLGFEITLNDGWSMIDNQTLASSIGCTASDIEGYLNGSKSIYDAQSAYVAAAMDPNTGSNIIVALQSLKACGLSSTMTAEEYAKAVAPSLGAEAKVVGTKTIAGNEWVQIEFPQGGIKADLYLRNVDGIIILLTCTSDGSVDVASHIAAY